VKPTPDEIAAGHAFYTERSLAVYDLAILGYFSRLAWKCPAGRVLRHYDEHVSANHLDIGVGTGYFLDRCRFPSPPRLVLMDPNEACLTKAGARLARYQPVQHRASVLEPIHIDGPRFDSIGMTYVLHCLPGDMASKATAFEHLEDAARPGAVVFGATLLHGGVKRNRLARTVMTRNNKHRIFSNADDDLEGLSQALSQHVDHPVIEVVGCVALFAGRR
jgi:hypothetical protein